MKVTGIEIINIQRITSLAHKPTAPITVFAGPNRAGKSSALEAIRMALCGTPSPRVERRGDYAELVHDGAKKGHVRVECLARLPGYGPDTEIECEYGYSLPAGKHSTQSAVEMPALPYLLDPEQFAALSHDERRKFLLGLMGVHVTPDSIVHRMEAKGAAPALIEQITLALAASDPFAAAEKAAKARATEARADWKATTGEAWGSQKGETWVAPVPITPASDAALYTMQAQLAQADAALAAANQKLGAIQADNRRAEQQVRDREQLQHDAGLLERAKAKAEKDAQDAEDYRATLETLKREAGEDRGEKHACPHCAGAIAARIHNYNATLRTVVIAAWDDKAGTPEARGKLAAAMEIQSRLDKVSENSKKALEAAQFAADALAKLPKEVVLTSEAPIQAEIAAQQVEKRRLETEIRSIEDTLRQAAAAREKTARARALHADILAWTAIADMLAPDGIPGEMLAEALGPLNARLTQSAAATGWPVVQIDADMEIRSGGRRRSLESRSARFAVDAMFAEAISHLSGLKFLALDGYDVLVDTDGDGPRVAHRTTLFRWLLGLVQAGELEQALLFGTHMERPAFPPAFGVVWLEGGQISQPGPDAIAAQAKRVKAEIARLERQLAGLALPEAA